MTRFNRIYYYAVLGALGGLISWQISNMISLSLLENIYLSEIVVGGLIGFCFGLLIGTAEGFFRKSIPYAIRSGLISGGLGLLGGAIGLPVAEALFQLIGGQPWVRSLGWGIFGSLVGLGIGYTGGSQAWKPSLGGFIGGVLGGTILEVARIRFSDPLTGKFVGLTLLGASIGVLIALIVMLLSKAWLEVTSGKLAGSEFILDKFIKSTGPTAFIGSDALKSDIVLPDPDIAPRHASLSGADSYMLIKDMSMSGTYLNGRKVEQGKLSDRQKIKVGNTNLIFHEKRI
jgi:hypothetical protein